MSVKVSYAVMGHVDRLDAASALAQAVGGVALIDDGAIGETRNGLRAWRWADWDSHPDWHVVLQDDALPIDGFTEHAAAALAHAPQTAVSFYVGRGRPRQPQVKFAIDVATMRQAAWLEHETLHWGVAVAMPTSHVQRFLDWVATGGGSTPHPLPYDRLVGEYWRRQGVPVRYTWPSLVDHDDGVPSILAHDREWSNGRRVAWQVGVPERWDTRAVAIK